MKELNERQQKRLELLASLAGSIKTPFEVNVDETINELRGKSSKHLMEIPLEFSFKLPDDRFMTLFFATKHDYQNQYAVAWKSTVFDDKIDITFYSAKDVEELVNDQKWIVKEVFK